MKKSIVLLLMATFGLAYITNGQTKSGILKKDHYGSFSGDDWEDFLAGRRAADFEKKSNVKLDDYLKNQVTPFVTSKLSESSIKSAVANSTVVAFPEDADVYTTTTDGTWMTRKAYPGEKGFFHTPSGLYWISFSCGNLTAFGPGPKKTVVQPAALTTVVPVTPASSNPNGININVNANPNANQTSLTYREGIGVFAEGAAFYAMVQNNTVALLKQNPLGCCGDKQTTVVPASITTTPMYLAASPVPALTSGNLDVTVRNKANGWEIANTILNGGNTFFNGVNTYRGVRLENNRFVNNNGYGNGWGSNFPLFQGDNQLGGNGSGGNGWGNTWSNTTLASGYNPTIRRGF
jgi:hypothetical protein